MIRRFYCLPLVCIALLFGCNATMLETGGSDTKLPLPAPRSVQVTALDGALMVNWTKIAAAQGREDVYEVYGGYGSNPAAAVKIADVYANETNLVSYTIRDLPNDVPYYVWVKAIYGDLGVSDFSPITYGIPIPPPAAPLLTNAAGEGSVSLSWPADNHAYYYEIYYIAGVHGGETPVSGAEKRTVADPPLEIAGTSTGGVIITGLTNGSAYSFWVKAVNTAGASAFALAHETPANEWSAPSAPSAVKVEGGGKKLKVSWPAVERAGSYKLYCALTNNPAAAAPVTVAPCFGMVSAEVTGLANNTTYHVWVKASNSQGDSAFSEAVSGKPEALAPINFNDIDFALGRATAEYIFSETNPPGTFPHSGELWDRLTRRKETSLGNLFCDGSAWYIRTNYPEENIDFMFLNGGYLDQPLYRGTVTVGSIESIPPPSSREDFFTIMTLKGPEVKAIFDHAADTRSPGRGSNGTGAWGMVSADVRYTIVYPQRSVPDYTNAYYGTIKEGSISINGAAFDINRSYRVCVANYIAGGGDGYVSFVLALRDYPETANVRNIKVPIWQGVCEYIYDKGVITPHLDGRVTLEGDGVMCE
jgi:hypothetical protein